MGIDPSTNAQKPVTAIGKTSDVAADAALPNRTDRGNLSTEELAAKWLAIGAENRRRFPDMPGSADIDAMLYDSETGLPVEDGTDFTKTDIRIA